MVVSSPDKFEYLFEIIDNLTVLELSQFISEYEKRYNVSRTPQIIQQIETPTTVEEITSDVKTTFEVYLLAPGVQKIQVIKELKEVTGKGLADSKSLADNPPAIIKSDLNKEDADSILRRFKDLGAEVEIR